MKAPEFYYLEDYNKQLERQNKGGVCEHCGSALGHYGTCLLLNRGVKYEAKPVVELAPGFVPQFSEADHIAAHALGVSLEDKK